MHRVIVTLVAAALLVAPASDARAQSATTLTRFGHLGLGAGVGSALGAMAASDDSCDGFVCIPAEVVAGFVVGSLVGLATGARTASAATRARDEGRPLSGPQAVSLTVGSVAGGAVIGALASAILINPEGAGTLLGSDEQTFALLVGAGAGLGLYKAIRFQRSILPGDVAVRPGVSRDGRVGVVGAVRFGGTRRRPYRGPSPYRP